MSTHERLQTLFAKDFDIAPERLHDAARLEDLEIDSLRMIEILFSVEDTFGITVGQEQSELRARLKTFGDLVDYIDALVAEQHPKEAPS